MGEGYSIPTYELYPPRPASRRKVWIVAAVFAATPALDAPRSGVLAATQTTTFAVTATVLSVCLVSAADLQFGNYSASAGTPLTASSSIIVNCTSGTSYTLELDKGAGIGAAINARSMTYLTNSLTYGLYTTSGYTTLWGDGTLSTQTVGGTGALSPVTHTVYGRVPTGQYVPSGLYSDLITVTLTY